MSPHLSNQAKQFLPIFKVWADEGSHPPVKLDRPVCVIGRREGGVNLPLHSPQVSKLHALVVRDKEQVYLRDLASTNGVHRNGAPVQEVGLSDEDVIRIGSYTLQCDSGFSQHANASADSEAGSSSALADEDVLPAAELRGERVSFPFPVGQHTVLIGRRNGCDLRLDDDDVAPVHAIVFQLDGKRHVRDLGAPAGTVLNGRLIHQEELKSGDELRIGGVTMRYALVDLEHDESDIPPLDGPHVPELDEPDVGALPDAEPELSAMDEPRIPLLDESQAPATEAPAPPPAPAVAASAAPVLPAHVEPTLDPSESHLGMNDSFISIEDSQAPGTADAGPHDSNVLEPPPSHEASFYGEVVQYAGEIFAAHPEPVAKEDAVVKPPPAPEPKEAVLEPSPFNPPLGSHANDVHAESSSDSKSPEISKLVEEVAVKAGALKEVWGEYHAGKGAKHDPDVTRPAP